MRGIIVAMGTASADLARSAKASELGRRAPMSRERPALLDTPGIHLSGTA